MSTTVQSNASTLSSEQSRSQQQLKSQFNWVNRLEREEHYFFSTHVHVHMLELLFTVRSQLHWVAVRFDDNCFGFAVVDGTSVGFVAFTKVGDAVVVIISAVDDVTEIDVLLWVVVVVVEEAPVVVLVEDNGDVTLLSSQTIEAINSRKITKIDILSIMIFNQTQCCTS